MSHISRHLLNGTVAKHELKTKIKNVSPVFQTGCMETQEYEDHAQHMWSAVPPAAGSSSVLNLRRMPH